MGDNLKDYSGWVNVIYWCPMSTDGLGDYVETKLEYWSSGRKWF